MLFIVKPKNTIFHKWTDLALTLTASICDIPKGEGGGGWAMSLNLQKISLTNL